MINLKSFLTYAGLLKWIISCVFAVLSVYTVFFLKGGLTLQAVKADNRLLLNITACYFSIFFLSLLMIFLMILLFSVMKTLRKLQATYPWHNQYASSVLQFTEINANPDICLTKHRNHSSFFFKSPEMAESLPQEETLSIFINSIQTQHIFEALHMEQMIQDNMLNEMIHQKFVYRLWEELLTEFPEQYLNQASELKLAIFLMKKSGSAMEAFKQAQILSNNYEFAVRIVFYLVADWCINIYSEYYHVNKNIFFVCKENSEQENLISKLNQFKGSLLNSKAEHVSDIVTLRLSLLNQKMTLTGELPEIYHNCCLLLNQSSPVKKETTC